MVIINLIKYYYDPHKVRVKYVFVGFYILLLATITSVAVAGNLDCTSNENDAERMVCSNQTLSALDAEISQIFKKTIRFTSREPRVFRMLQKQLDDCNADIACMIDVYEATIFRYSSPKIPTRTLMTVSNNECKTGQVFDNCKGTFTWTDGTEYSGNWKAGKRHGLGKQLSENGDIIIGYWENGFLNGKVKIKFSSGKYFLGSMKGGHYSGDATIYDKGMKYTGVFEYLDGSSIFRGIQYFVDGTQITINFKNLLEVVDDNIIKNKERIVASNLLECAPNIFHNCYGTYTWDTGEKYVGEWQNGMRVGNGVFTYKNGNKYTGSWQSNVPHGQGSLVATDGKVYVGQWIDGQYQPVQQTQNFASNKSETRSDNLCYKYNWKPSVFGNNTAAQNADIMARTMSAAQCIGYVVGYGKRLKSVTLEDEIFYRETIARLSQNFEGSCPKRELIGERDYKLEFEMGEAMFNANLAQNVTGSMNKSDLSARIFACQDVLEHYLQVLKKQKIFKTCKVASTCYVSIANQQ